MKEIHLTLDDSILSDTVDLYDSLSDEDKLTIIKRVVELDPQEKLSDIVVIPRSTRWRVRREDFGGLAFFPKTADLIRLDGEQSVNDFIDSHDVAQVVEGRSIANSLRTPTKLFLDITQICNEKCVHCLSRSGLSRNTLPTSVIASVLEQAYAMGIFQLKLGGGEPVLHPRFFEIVSKANALGMTVSISTNAVTMTRARVRLLKAAEVKVSVSIDGDEEKHDTVRGAGAYRRALKGIELLLEEGIRPGLRMTLFNHPQLNNLSVVKDVVDLGRHYGLPVKLRRAKPSGRASDNDLSLAFPTQDYWELLEWLDQIKAQGATVDIEDLMCLTGDGSDKIFPTEFDCAAGTRSIHVDVYGNISPCVFLGASHHSGNVFFHALDDIWSGGSGFQRARDYTTQANSDCRSCDRNKLCSGECRALVFQAQRTLGVSIHGGGKDPCCPKERRVYAFQEVSPDRFIPLQLSSKR